MSEDILRSFLDRLNGDASFRASVQKDPTAAFDEFGLSPSERVAYAGNDEDALRRLAGTDVSAFALPGGPGTGLGWDLSIFSWCHATDYCITPGSGKGCGTGPRGCGTYDCGDDLKARA